MTIALVFAFAIQEAPTTLKTYDIRELVAPADDMPSKELGKEWSPDVMEEPGYQIVDLITQAVDRGGWENEDHSISYSDGALVVRTTAGTHLLVERFLDGLRKATFDHPIQATLAAIPWKDGAITMATGSLSAAEFAEIEKRLGGEGVVRQRVALSGLNGQRVSASAGPASGDGADRLVIDVRPIVVPGEKASLLDVGATGLLGGAEFQSRSVVRVAWDGAYVMALGRAGDERGYFLILQDRISADDVSALTTQGMLQISDENLAPLSTVMFDTADLSYEIPSYPAPEPQADEDETTIISLGGAEFTLNNDKIYELIRNSTGGQTWDTNENAAIWVMDNKLIVSQSAAVIDEIKGLLPSLRKSYSACKAVTVRLSYVELDAAGLAAFEKRFHAAGYPVYFDEATSKEVIGALASAPIVDDVSVTSANTQRAHTQVYRRTPSPANPEMQGAVADVQPTVSADGTRVTLTLRSKLGREKGLATNDGTYRVPAGGGFVSLVETGKGTDGAATHLVMLARVTVQR